MARLGEEVKYWSNALGELHHHGEYDITEGELPDELKRAYNELYYNSGGSLCYLAETKKGYSIALVNEYDSYTAKEVAKTSKKELFDAVISDALEISKHEEFKKAVQKLDKLAYKVVWEMGKEAALDARIEGANTNRQGTGKKEGVGKQIEYNK